MTILLLSRMFWIRSTFYNVIYYLGTAKYLSKCRPIVILYCVPLPFIVLCTHRGRRRRRLDRSGFPSGPVPGQAIRIFWDHGGGGGKASTSVILYVIPWLVYKVLSKRAAEITAVRWILTGVKMRRKWPHDNNIIILYFPCDASKSDTPRPQRNTRSGGKIADVHVIMNLLWSLIRLFVDSTLYIGAVAPFRTENCFRQTL